MSFLAPLYLLGGLAVALPIVFHLVRRASREKMTFSSLMFLKPTPPRMTRRNRLEHLFLLLLRCLVICALSIAFARPFLQRPTAATPAPAITTRWVILVDRSASMRRDTLWADAVARAESWLRRAGPADQVALYAFDEQTQPVVSFTQWNALSLGERASAAVNQLRALQPSWLATQSGHAILTAAETLDDAGKAESTEGPKRIVLITDLQEGSHLDALQGHEWARGLEVEVDVVRTKRPTNAGVQWLADSEDSERQAVDGGIRLRVSNSSDAQREQFQIRWEGAANTPSLDAYVPPGQGRIILAPKPPRDGAAGRLVLSGDDAAFDDTVYVVPPRAEEAGVLFVGDATEKDPAQMPYYLKRAFQTTQRRAITLSQALPAALAATPTPFPSRGLTVVGSAMPETARAALRRHLEGGGTALLVMDTAAVAESYGAILGASGFTAAEAPSSWYAMLTRLDFRHPILAAFADPRFGDFTKIRFWGHRKIDANTLPGSRVIAWFDHEEPAILEVLVGRGRAFLFTFSWRPADSQFALSSKFVPLMNSILDQAVGSKTAPAQYRVGDPLELASLPFTDADEVSILKPDGDRVRLTPGTPRFSGLDQPGIYDLTAGTNRISFAVNLDPTESRTGPLQADELTRLGVPMATSVAAAAQTPSNPSNLHAAELESRQKYWRWLLMAALGVLLFETWLAGWLTRRSATRMEVSV